MLNSTFWMTVLYASTKNLLNRFWYSGVITILCIFLRHTSNYIIKTENNTITKIKAFKKIYISKLTESEDMKFIANNSHTKQVIMIHAVRKM